MADGNKSARGARSDGRTRWPAGIVAASAVMLLGITAADHRQMATIGAVGSSFVVGQAHAQGSPASAGDKSPFTDDQVKALHGIIRDYLMTNPEILRDVSQELERKHSAEQAAKAEKFLLANKDKVFNAGTDFVLGNPKGDVTIVEFFDYNCGWCKRAVDDLVKITKADPKVRVVLKEYPIFGGPPSVLAAKAAMASIRQGKYWEYHTALMRERQVTEQNVYTVAQKVGLDVNRLKADMADKKLDAIIEQNIGMGQELGMEGTPAFLIDSRINVGYIAVDGMQKMLAEIRKAGCKVC
jgi:protein-disulfide isomerase